MPKFIVELPLPDLPEGTTTSLVGLPIIFKSRVVSTVESMVVSSGGYEIIFDITDPGFRVIRDLKFSIGSQVKGESGAL